MTMVSITSLVSVMALFLARYNDGMMVTAFSNNNNALLTTTTIPHHISSSSSSTNLNMVSDNKAIVVELPRDVKEAVSKCRQATQDALAKRLSRMDIEFPVGTDFGVEKKSKPTKGGGRGKRRQDADIDGDDESNIQTTLDRSDRELARLFVEMFQPVGGDNIAVSFVDDSLADAAKSKWKNDLGSTCRVLAMNRRPGGGAKKKKKGKKVLTSARGFAAKLEAEIGSSDDDDDNENDKTDFGGKGGSFQLPSTTEVALFVAPGPKELIVIEKICETMGMGTLVILLNARLDKVTNYGTAGTEKLFTEDFDSVFSLAAAPQEEAPNCLLFRAYPGEWVLARKPNVGRPKTILSQTEKPTTVECRQAFDELEITDLEKNVEGFVDNVAGWFR